MSSVKPIVVEDVSADNDKAASVAAGTNIDRDESASPDLGGQVSERLAAESSIVTMSDTE